jgi:hypothetical protein
VGNSSASTGTETIREIAYRRGGLVGSSSSCGAVITYWAQHRTAATTRN